MSRTNCYGGFFQDKRVLVTGHTGFIGKWLSRVLLHVGADVTGLSYDLPESNSMYESNDNKVKQIQGDICDKEFVKRILKEIKPEIVIHLAAQSRKEISLTDPETTFESNVIGTFNVLEASRCYGCVKSFVFASSEKVYKSQNWSWGYREVDELEGLSPFINSKICCEQLIDSYRASFFKEYKSMSLSSVRFGNAIGGGDYTNGKIISDCLIAAKEGTMIEIHDNETVRPYHHVLDTVCGLLLIAQRQYEDKNCQGTYNIGPNPENCAMTTDLVRLFCSEWGEGLNSKLNIRNAEVDAPKAIRLDCSKITKSLMWVSTWNIKTTIKKLVEFEKAVQSGISASKIMDKQIKEYYSEIKSPKNPCF
jgi:Nucleoside-diphosphate-sugar epimerases